MYSDFKVALEILEFTLRILVSVGLSKLLLAFTATVASTDFPSLPHA